MEPYYTLVTYIILLYYIRLFKEEYFYKFFFLINLSNKNMIFVKTEEL